MKAKRNFRRKACFACAKLKRQCDKGLPSCARCSEKGEVCQYPENRPYSRQTQTQYADPKSTETLLPPAPGALSLQSTDMRIGEDPYAGLFSGEDTMFTELWPSTLTFIDAVTTYDEYGSESGWFLGESSRFISEYEFEDFVPARGRSQWKAYMDLLNSWLKLWVETNSCPFIHSFLYAREGLPPCLLDAYSVLTAYLHKLSSNEDVILQLLDTKVNALIKEENDQTSEKEVIASAEIMPRIRNKLAQVQALFIYQVIRLFDGNIRQRVKAEKSIDVLFQWRSQLWDLFCAQAQRLETYCAHGSQGLGEESLQMRTWQCWILAESIRRTWLVVTYTQSLYIGLRDGEVDCPGSLALTLQNGLWDAPTAVAWMRCLQLHGPLFLRLDPPQTLKAAALPDSVDHFGVCLAKVFWHPNCVASWQ